MYAFEALLVIQPVCKAVAPKRACDRYSDAAIDAMFHAPALANTAPKGTIEWARQEYAIESPVDFRWNVIEKAFDLESATLTEVINTALDEDDLITRVAGLRNLKGRNLSKVNLSHIEWQIEQMDELERSIKRSIRRGIKVEAARRQLGRVWQITDLLNAARYE